MSAQLLAALLVAAPADPPPVATARPLFQNYCFRCHDAEKQEGGLDFTTILADEASARDRPKLWRRALERVTTGAMPPSDSDQPTPADRAALLRWFAARAGLPEAKPGPPTAEPVATLPLPCPPRVTRIDGLRGRCWWRSRLWRTPTSCCGP